MRDGSAEVVFTDERFAENVRIGEAGGRVREEVREVKGFVLADLEGGGARRGEGGPGRKGSMGREVLVQGGKDEELDIGVFVVN